MSVRAGLRRLINSLEARYLLLPNVAHTLEQDINGLTASNNELIMKGGISVRETLCTALDAVLEAVRNEQHQIQTALARWQNWQRPAVRLPAEILSTIFDLACIPQLASPILKSRHRQSLRKTRAAIRQTCSRWADIALGTSCLWSTIESIYTTYDPRRNYSNRAVVLTEFERSAGRPLSLHIRADQLSKENLEPLLSPLFHHCEFLQITVTWSQAHSLFDAPMLRNLRSLVLDLEHHRGEGDHSMIDLSEAPLLCDLWILRTGSLYPKTVISPPVSCNIARLHLEGGVDTASAIHLINSCQRLETLFWCDRGIRTIPSQLPKFETLQCLRRLSLVDPTALSFFKFIMAPALVQLRLISVGDTLDHPLTVAPRFPCLRGIEIEIRSRSTGEDGFETFFTAHPDIEDIVFTLVKDTLPSVGSATLFGAHPSNLKRLWLKSTDTHRFGEQHVADLRRIWLSRLAQKQGPGPRSFKVYICPPYTVNDPTVEEELSRLRAMSTNSIALEVRSPPDEEWRCPGPFGARTRTIAE